MGFPLAINALVALRADVEILKAAAGHMLTVGTVAELDAEKGYRIETGQGTEGPMLSPWLPHPESGGQTDSWLPLSQGQTVGILAPAGDLRQGVLLRGGFTGPNPPPSQDLQENVLDGLGVRLSVKDGVLTVEADRVVVKADSVLAEADKVELGGEGGPKVARVGDKVFVQYGSSKGLHPIVEGSETVFAVD